MFASLGWGLFSALSGLLVSKFSIYTAFQLYFVLEAFAIIPVCLLRFHARPSLAQVSTCIVLHIYKYDFMVHGTHCPDPQTVMYALTFGYELIHVYTLSW